MTEAELLKEVLRLCSKYHHYAFHSTDSRKDQGKQGFPDLCIVGTSVLFAELKTNYGSMSIKQTDWRYKIQAAGAKHVIWRPSDLENGTIEQVLKDMSTRVE